MIAFGLPFIPLSFISFLHACMFLIVNDCACLFIPLYNPPSYHQLDYTLGNVCSAAGRQ